MKAKREAAQWRRLRGTTLTPQIQVQSARSQQVERKYLAVLHLYC